MFVCVCVSQMRTNSRQKQIAAYKLGERNEIKLTPVYKISGFVCGSFDMTVARWTAELEICMYNWTALGCSVGLANKADERNNDAVALSIVSMLLLPN